MSKRFSEPICREPGSSGRDRRAELEALSHGAVSRQHTGDDLVRLAAATCWCSELTTPRFGAAGSAGMRRSQPPIPQAPQGWLEADVAAFDDDQAQPQLLRAFHASPSRLLRSTARGARNASLSPISRFAACIPPLEALKRRGMDLYFFSSSFCTRQFAFRRRRFHSPTDTQVRELPRTASDCAPICR